MCTFMLLFDELGLLIHIDVMAELALALFKTSALYNSINQL